MHETVTFTRLPLVPLTKDEFDATILNEMQRRAWAKACKDWLQANPNKGAWFINGDVSKQMAKYDAIQEQA